MRLENGLNFFIKAVTFINKFSLQLFNFVFVLFIRANLEIIEVTQIVIFQKVCSMLTAVNTAPTFITSTVDTFTSTTSGISSVWSERIH